MVKVLQVGDVIEPNEGAQEHYGMTCKPTMTKGVVVKIHEGRTYADIRIRITEGEDVDFNNEIGNEYDVHSKHFNLVRPLTKDEAFESLVKGNISDAEYIQLLKKIQKET